MRVIARGVETGEPLAALQRQLAGVLAPGVSVDTVEWPVAAAMGLGLQQWIAGLVLWIVGHTLAVFAAKRDPDFAAVLARHLRQKGWWSC